MQFAAIWMDLEIIILSEFRERQMSYNNHVESKNHTCELNYKTETDSQAQIINLWLSKGKGGGGG